MKALAVCMVVGCGPGLAEYTPGSAAEAMRGSAGERWASDFEPGRYVYLERHSVVAQLGTYT